MTTLKKYSRDYSGAPYDLTEFAEGAVHVTDKPELAEAAKAFLKAQKEFKSQLDANDVEMG
jgi:hypothetical protein